MNLPRHLSSRRRLAAGAAAVAATASLGVAGAAISSDGPKPPEKPLDRALLDASRAKAPQGITARIELTNELVPATAVPGASPLLGGASGRLWLADDGRMRLELQSDSGDAQITSDGESLTVYDPTSRTQYRLAPSKGDRREEQEGAGKAVEPTQAGIERALERLGEVADIGGPTPGTVAGRGAYTVRLAPRRDGGLLGAAELAWDAANGTPLRAAVYAGGQDEPVLEIAATDVQYGSVSASALEFRAPAGTRKVDLKEPDAAKLHSGARATRVEGLAAVRKRLPFELAAPDELVGLPRREVRLIESGGEPAAMVMYGRGLGALVVIQSASGGQQAEKGPLGALPKVSVDGATGSELATALGTVLRFEDGGVSHVLAGSLPPAAAEQAARDLR